jgi:hypothetical protein
MKRTNQAVETDPEWLSVDAACHRVGMGRTTFYQSLINTGLVRSCVIRKPGNVKGLRRISRVSLDQYLSSLVEVSQVA